MENADMNKAIKSTIAFVKQELDGMCSAHDWYHIERVWKLAKKIQLEEARGDLLVVELGALLHESFDEKFFSMEELVVRKQVISDFLRDLGLSGEQFKKVYFIIENVGFSKSLKRTSDFSACEEFYIVEDADRLEAIGAIAIARTFAYGGKKKRAIYDPEVPLTTDIDVEGYHTTEGSAIHHFYEKLLKLKHLLVTGTAKEMAEKRHEFMERFLEQFHAEWNLDV